MSKASKASKYAVRKDRCGRWVVADNAHARDELIAVPGGLSVHPKDVQQLILWLTVTSGEEDS